MPLNGQDKILHILICAAITIASYMIFSGLVFIFDKQRKQQQYLDRNNDDNELDVESSAGYTSNSNHLEQKRNLFIVCLNAIDSCVASTVKFCVRPHVRRLIISALTALVAGLAKEIVDAAGLWGHASVWDMVANIIGTIVGLIILVVWVRFLGRVETTQWASNNGYGDDDVSITGDDGVSNEKK